MTRVVDATLLPATADMEIGVSVPGQLSEQKFKTNLGSAALLSSAVISGFVDVTNHGAVSGGNATTNRLAFQAAVDYAIANNIGVVRVPFGTFSLDGPVIARKLSGSSYDYLTITITGMNSCKAAASHGIHSRVNFTHKNSFGFGIQNARGCVIKNLYITGQYNPTFSIKQIIENDITQWTGLATSAGIRNTQFSPYAGVVISPFGTDVPSDGGYPGLSSYYKSGAEGASGCSIEDCHISNFLLDVIIGPNGQTQNDESVNIINCRLYHSMIAAVYGQSQTRNCVMRDVDVGFVWAGVSTFKYGNASGSPPMISNLLFVAGRMTLDINTQRGNVYMYNIQAENFGSIGRVQGNLGCTFDTCSFKFNWGTGGDSQYAKAPDTIISGQTGNGRVVFRGCSFRSATLLETDFHCFTGGVHATFDSCDFISNQIPYCGSGATHRFINCTLDGTKRFGFGSMLVRGDVHAVVSRDPMWINFGNQTRILHANIQTYAAPGNVTITVNNTNATATVTVADGTKFAVGDAVYITGTFQYFTGPDGVAGSGTSNAEPYIGIVKSISSNTLTLGQIPYWLADGTTGQIRRHKRYLYAGTITGDITSGSNVITNISYELNPWTNVGRPNYSALVGHDIVNSQFPNGTKFTQINDSTIVMSSNATGTAVGADIQTAVVSDVS